MANQDFVFGAKMDLRGPTPADLAIIKKQINSGLRGASASISIKTDKSNVAYQKQIRDLETLHKNIRKVGVSAKTSSEDIEEFGRRIGIAGKRYLAFSVATVGVVKALGALRTGLKDALDFEREIVKIGQVSGRSLKQLSGLRDEILSTGAAFGVSSDEIASAAVTLAQTGRPLKEIRKDLEAITKASLAPTFGDAKDTVEGLIAVQNQFGRSAGSTIEVLSKLNAVAGQFPVESSDLITAVKKTGGAFRAAGGDLDQLLSLFTSVRSTTRESADTIGTAFRTITGRLGRIKTIDFFKDVLDVDLLQDGKILAPFQAIEKIVEGLNKKNLLGDAGKKSPVFASIVEELGGIRQRAKVIPLLTEFNKAQEVLNVSQTAGTSITEDAIKAQEGLGVQVVKVKEEFQKFVDNVLKDPVFRNFATELLDISRALIRIADASRPLIPLAGVIGAVFAAKASVPLLTGILPTVPKIKTFAKGGLNIGTGKIPGVGSRDTEIFAGMPGEYIIKKSSVLKYGTDFLDSLNTGQIEKFANGGASGKKKKYVGIGPELPANLFGSAPDDLRTRRRNTYEPPIGSFSGFQTVIKELADDLGVSIEGIISGFQDLTAAQRQAVKETSGIVPSAAFNPTNKRVYTNVETATKGSALEELIHAQDLSLGGGRKFASQIAGTLQNNVVKKFLPIIQEEVEKTADFRGLTGEKRKKYISARTSPQEVFAAAVRRQPKKLQRELLGTASLEEIVRNTLEPELSQPEKNKVTGYRLKRGKDLKAAGLTDLDLNSERFVEGKKVIPTLGVMAPSANPPISITPSQIAKILNSGKDKDYVQAAQARRDTAARNAGLDPEGFSRAFGLTSERFFGRRKVERDEVKPDTITADDIAKVLNDRAAGDKAKESSIKKVRNQAIKRAGLTDEDFQVTTSGGLTNKTKRDLSLPEFFGGPRKVKKNTIVGSRDFNSGFAFGGLDFGQALRVDREPARRDPRDRERVAEDAALARARFGDLSKKKKGLTESIGGPFRGFASGSGIAAASVFGGAAIAGGLLENEQGQRVAANLGAIAFQFGALNTVLSNSKGILVSRERLEKSHVKLVKASQTAEILGLQSQKRQEIISQQTDIVSSSKEKLLAGAKNQRQLIGKLERSIGDETDLNTRLKDKNLTDDKRAILEDNLLISKKNTTEIKNKIKAQNADNVLSEKAQKNAEKEIVLQEQSLAIANKKQNSARQAIAIQKKAVAAEQKNIQRQEKINRGIAVASAVATIGGGFVSSLGKESLSKGDSSGLSLVAGGGAVSGAGVGLGIGSLFGPAGAAFGAAAGALVGFTAGIFSATEELKNFRAETIKGIVEASKGNFRGESTKDNPEGVKFDQATIGAFVKQLRGDTVERQKDNPEQTASSKFGRFANATGTGLAKITDFVLGRTNTVNAVTRNEAQGFFTNAGSAAFETNTNILNQEKSLSLQTGGRELRKVLQSNAEDFDGTFEEFNQRFGGLIKEGVKRLNPVTFARGDLDDIQAAIDLETGYLEKHFNEAQAKKKQTADLIKRLGRAEAGIFDNFAAIDDFLGVVRERVNSLSGLKNKISFLSSGNLGATGSIAPQVSNVLDVSSFSNGPNIPAAFRGGGARFGSDREKLNVSAIGLSSRFGGQGKIIGEQFADFSNAVPKVKDFVRELVNLQEVDANQLDGLKDKLLRGTSGATRQNLRAGIDQLFKVPEGEGATLNTSEIDMGGSINSLLGRFDPIKRAMQELVDVFDQQTNDLRNNLSESRALKQKASEAELGAISVRQQSKDILSDLLNTPKTFTGERQARLAVTGGKSPLELGNRIRGANANILGLEEQKQKLISQDGPADAFAKIEDAISRETAARDKAIQGLNFLTDITNRTAQAQEEFRRAEVNRNAAKNLLEIKAFGSGKEVAQLNSKQEQLQGIVSGNLDVSGFSNKKLKELFDFSKGFDDALIPDLKNKKGQGLTGKQVSDFILFKSAQSKGLGTDQGLKDIVLGTKNKVELEKNVNKGAQDASNATLQLAGIFSKQAEDLAIAARESFAKVFEGFKADKVIIQNAQIEGNQGNNLALSGELNLNVNLNAGKFADEFRPIISELSKTIAKAYVDQALKDFAKQHDMSPPTILSAGGSGANI